MNTSTNTSTNTSNNTSNNDTSTKDIEYKRDFVVSGVISKVFETKYGKSVSIRLELPSVLECRDMYTELLTQCPQLKPFLKEFNGSYYLNGKVHLSLMSELEQHYTGKFQLRVGELVPQSVYFNLTIIRAKGKVEVPVLNQVVEELDDIPDLL